MSRTSIIAFLILVTAGSLVYFRSGNAGGMMAGGGMMERPTNLGAEPKQETNKSLENGYGLAKVTCAQCHTMPAPEKHTKAEWPDVITRMEGHITTYKKVMPTDAELKSIRDYYIGNAAP